MLEKFITNVMLERCYNLNKKMQDIILNMSDIRTVKSKKFNNDVILSRITKKTQLSQKSILPINDRKNNYEINKKPVSLQWTDNGSRNINGILNNIIKYACPTPKFPYVPNINNGKKSKSQFSENEDVFKKNKLMLEHIMVIYYLYEIGKKSPAQIRI